MTMHPAGRFAMALGIVGGLAWVARDRPWMLAGMIFASSIAILIATIRLTRATGRFTAELRRARDAYEAARALSLRDPGYYARAVDLVCDELEALKPEDLDDRRLKMIAILRHAALAFNQ